VDYLTANAWVVLVSIVGILVLWQIGLFTPPVPKRGSMGFSQLMPTDWAVSTDDLAYVRLKNDAGIPVKIPVGGLDLMVQNVRCNSSPSPSENVTIKPGTSRLFILQCLSPPTVSENFKAGDYYEGDLTMDYVNTVSGRYHISVGKVFGPIEGRVVFGGPPSTTLPGNCGKDCGGQGGILNASICIEENLFDCPYCDLYTWECVPQGSCGLPCTASTEVTDCVQTCEWCNTTAPGGPICQQGDCGKQCYVDDDCTYGCDWCINGVCSEESSCGKPCSLGGMVDPLECKVECEFCYDYSFECIERGACGEACLSNEDCPEICCYCGSSHTCEQGDCGKPCSVLVDVCENGCNQCIGGTCRGCAVESLPSTTTTTSASSTTTTTIPGGYIIVGQVYPENGSSA
jgi:hypothetical protein